MTGILMMMKCKILADLINKRKFKSYVEVGVWKGDNLKYIADHCKSLELIRGVDSYRSEDYKGIVKPIPQEELDDIYYKMVLLFETAKYGDFVGIMRTK